MFVFPAVAVADRLAVVDGAGAQTGQGALFRGVALAAVLDQRRPRDGTVGREELDFGDQAARRDRLGLAGVADAPQLRTRRGGDSFDERGGVTGTDL